jgi:hypothetical protein
MVTENVKTAERREAWQKSKEWWKFGAAFAKFDKQSRR